jgi:hypothetical protein
VKRKVVGKVQFMNEKEKKRELKVPHASSPAHSADKNNVNGEVRIVGGSYLKQEQLNYDFLIDGDMNNLRSRLTL